MNTLIISGFLSLLLISCTPQTPPDINQQLSDISMEIKCIEYAQEEVLKIENICSFFMMYQNSSVDYVNKTVYTDSPNDWVDCFGNITSRTPVIVNWTGACIQFGLFQKPGMLDIGEFEYRRLR